MYIVAIAWVFVVLLMSLTEATSTQGSLLGALVTALLYGVLPLSIVLYVMATPARRRARLLAEQQLAEQRSIEQQESSQGPAPAATSGDPDSCGVAPGEPVAPERKEA
jgi:hypothetical protein